MKKITKLKLVILLIVFIIILILVSLQSKVVASMEVSYTIHFDANGGTGTMQDQKITQNSTHFLNPNIFVQGEYTFMGWNTEADGTGTSYTDRQDVSNLSNQIGEMTLYAQWEFVKYTIHFDANGGTGTMEDQIITQAAVVNLPDINSPIGSGVRTFPRYNGHAYKLLRSNTF